MTDDAARLPDLRHHAETSPSIHCPASPIDILARRVCQDDGSIPAIRSDSADVGRVQMATRAHSCSIDGGGLTGSVEVGHDKPAATQRYTRIQQKRHLDNTKIAMISCRGSRVSAHRSALAVTPQSPGLSKASTRVCKRQSVVAMRKKQKGIYVSTRLQSGV